MSKSDLTKTHDFLGRPFVEATCKRCGTKYRRMEIDKLMPICPPCEPEDSAEWRAKQNKNKAKTKRKL